MSDPTDSPSTVNPQITDAVTQANAKVLGDAPPLALSDLYQAISQSMALAAGNAVTAQQQANVIHQAATTMGVTALYTLGNAGITEAVEKQDE
ncbi:MAG: RebB family R body protein [Myxococcales bacterium]|nr:RebB family R body protein [Myxococcales bacterium]